jgi:hypothetical protein
VLLLACLLAWVAFRLVRAGSGAEDGSARILRIREERVFASVRPFERLRVVPVEPSGVTAVGAERYDGPLAGVCAAASGRLRAAGRPGFDFVVLRGRARGEAEVHCRDASGRTVRRVLAVVRGVRRPEWPRELDRAAGRALAEERLRDGRRLAADGRLHGAIARYDEALALFRTHGADDPDRLATVRMELAPLEAGLWREARDLLERALALAYPASAEVRPPRLAAASTVLEDLKRLLPDPESVERQVVDLWQIRIDLEARRPAR